MGDLQLSDYVQQLLMDMERLKAITNEVDQLVADGSLDAAAMVLGSQTGKVTSFQDSYDELRKRLREEGADPQRGILEQG